MSVIEKIGHLFLDEPQLISSSETFAFAEVSLEGKNLKIPTSDVLLKTAQLLPHRDKLHLSAAIDSDPVTFSSEKPESAAEFESECQLRRRVADASSSATITISISKTLREAAVSLYSTQAFSRTLQPKTFRERLKIFEVATSLEGSVWVQLLEDISPFLTKTLHFSQSAPAELPSFRRQEIREKNSELCHCEYASATCIPDDFYLLIRSRDEDFNAVFDDLCACTSLVSIADISEEAREKQNGITFKLNGYKVITGRFPSGSIDSQSAQAWFRIYEWVYSAGGISDKLGLARNIMSLHWKGSPSDLVEPGVFTSLRSAYELYLKRNVERYIEVRSKLNDYLSDFSVKAMKLADGLAEKFEKSVTAFVSFFITSILAKVLTDRSFAGVFNRPVAIIGIVIVAGSTLHLCLSVYVFQKDKRRLEGDWDLLKRRYSDLLDESDLCRIFDKSTGFSQAQEHLTSKRTLFVAVWSALLCVALTLILKFSDWKTPVTGDAAGATNSVPAQVSTYSTNMSPATGTNHKP